MLDLWFALEPSVCCVLRDFSLWVRLCVKVLLYVGG